MSSEPDPNSSLIGNFFRFLAEHLLTFGLFLFIPAIAGAVIGSFLGSTTGILICAGIGAVIGFFAYCVWNWSVLFTLIDL
jgi:hypothetical protein